MPPVAEIEIADDALQLAREGVDMFIGAADACLKEKGLFTVAISGGSSPGEMYRMLSREPALSKWIWEKTHVFWVDERCVPATDTASNYGSVKKDLLDLVPIPAGNVHNMPADLPPRQGARRYEEGLMEFFKLKEGQFPVFDMIFLGIGNDGHTASLFPGHPVLKERKRLVADVKGGDPDIHRLTLTFPVLNNSEKVVFLVSGKDKSWIMREVLGHGGRKKFPAQMVRPVKGGLVWLIDREAASLFY